MPKPKQVTNTPSSIYNKNDRALLTAIFLSKRKAGMATTRKGYYSDLDTGKEPASDARFMLRSYSKTTPLLMSVSPRPNQSISKIQHALRALSNCSSPHITSPCWLQSRPHIIFHHDLILRQPTDSIRSITDGKHSCIRHTTAVTPNRARVRHGILVLEDALRWCKIQGCEGSGFAERMSGTMLVLARG